MNNRTRVLVFCAISIALNIVLGIITSSLKLPFYLDVLGTIFIAVLYGPFYGACVGGLTNLITGIIFNPKDIPFLIVNVAIGLIVGLIAKKFKFNLTIAIITGFILSIVAPLIGTPIGIWVYGGLTGTGLDFIFIWLRETGNSIFLSSFLPKVFNNLIDKIGSCILVYFVIKNLPKKYLPKKYLHKYFEY